MKERCEDDSFKVWLDFIKDPKNSPESMELETGIPAELLRKAARLFAKEKNGSKVKH